MILMDSQCCTLESDADQQWSATDTVLSNNYFFSIITESQRKEKTCLPFQLGLSNNNYQQLKQFLLHDKISTALNQASPEEDLRQELLTMRGDEWIDLRNLLIGNRSKQLITEIWMAEIVAAACLGGDHLWRDLGLPDRESLSVLLNNNFHPLAKKNTRDMKWKKFFYKQLCEQEGSYVCRAPSCEVCKAYDDCFGLEE